MKGTTSQEAKIITYNTKYMKEHLAGLKGKTIHQ